jgi:hypothetical protein
MDYVVLDDLPKHRPKNDIDCEAFVPSTSVVSLQIVLLIRAISTNFNIPE